jgi:hypothetical protein
VRLGFPPDWWIAPELAKEWQSKLFPLQPTNDSNAQWQNALGEIGNDYLRRKKTRLAEGIVADLRNDLDIMGRADVGPVAEIDRCIRAICTPINLLDVARVSAAKKAAPAELVPIIALGPRRYSVDDYAVTVTVKENNVLQALAKQSPLDEPMLVALSGEDDAAKIIRRLCNEKYDGRFAKGIRLAGGKGKGGYHAVIVPAGRTSQASP